MGMEGLFRKNIREISTELSTGDMWLREGTDPNDVRHRFLLLVYFSVHVVVLIGI